jgi:transcriptional regulator with XRE-family HTH domain
MPDRENAAFGAYLKKKRLEAGLTQIDVAKILGYTPQFVTNWENGRSNPPARVLATLVRVLKIEEEEFLNVLSDISMAFWRKTLRMKRVRSTSARKSG